LCETQHLSGLVLIQGARHRGNQSGFRSLSTRVPHLTCVWGITSSHRRPPHSKSTPIMYQQIEARQPIREFYAARKASPHNTVPQRGFRYTHPSTPPRVASIGAVTPLGSRNRRLQSQHEVATI